MRVYCRDVNAFLKTGTGARTVLELSVERLTTSKDVVGKVLQSLLKKIGVVEIQL